MQTIILGIRQILILLSLLLGICLLAFLLGLRAGGWRMRQEAAPAAQKSGRSGSGTQLPEPAQNLPENWALMQETATRNYRCRYFQNLNASDEGRAEIWKGGKLIAEEEYDIANDYVPPPGSDVTGDHIPDRVLLRTYMLGMHSYYEYKIIPGETGGSIIEFGALRTALTFADLDNDGVFEASGEDWDLEYWSQDYNQSPHPRYILRFSNDGYHLVLDLMKNPAPASAKLRQEVEAVRQEAMHNPDELNLFESTVGQEIWKYMCDLIYEGNGKSAWKFYDLLWAKHNSFGKHPFFAKAANKRKFLKDFRHELTMSPFWPEIQDLNHWRPDDPR